MDRAIIDVPVTGNLFVYIRIRTVTMIKVIHRIAVIMVPPESIAMTGKVTRRVIAEISGRVVPWRVTQP